MKAIAERLQVGVGTVHRILALFDSTDDVQPNHQSERDGKLDDCHELYVIGLLAENPSLYLMEICQLILQATNVSVSPATVCRLLKRNGFTRKKIVQVAKQRSSCYRGRFMAEVMQYPRNFFVWMDETGADGRDQIRKFGYAIRGIEPVYHRFLHRGIRIPALAANGIFKS